MILETLAERCPESYLVGGAVRDALMEVARGGDLDLAVQGDGYRLAAELAAVIGPSATFVPLDRKRGTGRVVIEKGVAGELDISSFKGDSIDEDLGARDFTINAMAVRLSDLLQSGTDHLVDPRGGQRDLAKRRIRACSPKAFHDDSLRILRAFRLAARLGFRIAAATLEMIPSALPLLAGVAPERIRDEVFQTLQSDQSFPTVQGMDQRNVLGTIFPELLPMKGVGQNPFHHLDVWDHSLECVFQLEELLAGGAGVFGELRSTIRDYADEQLVTGRSKECLMKLALLFHDAGKPACLTRNENGRIRFFGHEKVSRRIFEEAGERMRLAVREIRLVGEWIGGHMRPMIFTGEVVSKRALHRLHARFGHDIIGLLLIFLADLRATQGPAREPGESELAFQRVCEALKGFLEAAKKPQSRLLNGNDIMRALGLHQGPVVGQILKRVAELHATGKINTTQEALVAATQYWNEWGQPEAGD